MPSGSGRHGMHVCAPVRDDGSPLMWSRIAAGNRVISDAP